MSKKSDRFIPLGKSYPLEVRLAAVRDYLSGKGSRVEIAARYHIGYARTIDTWVRKFGPKELSLGQNITVMGHPSSGCKKRRLNRDTVPGERELALSREVDLLRAQLQESEKSKKHLQIKVNALETLIDIAESSYDIPIRKNSGAKQ
jgi:transposase-like protein